MCRGGAHSRQETGSTAQRGADEEAMDMVALAHDIGALANSDLMPRLRLGAVCDHAALNHDGTLNLDGICDRIVAPALPTQLPRLVLGVVLDLAPGVHEVRVDLRAPDGHSLLLDEGAPGVVIPVRVPDGCDSANLVVQVDLLPLRQPGRHAVVLSIAGEPLGAIPLTVVTLDEMGPCDGVPSAGGSASTDPSRLTVPADPVHVAALDIQTFQTDGPYWAYDDSWLWRPTVPCAVTSAYGGTVVRLRLDSDVECSA